MTIPEWIQSAARSRGVAVNETENAISGDGIMISSLGIEFKLAIETKCHRCKAIDVKIVVA